MLSGMGKSDSICCRSNNHLFWAFMFISSAAMWGGYFLAISWGQFIGLNLLHYSTFTLSTCRLQTDWLWELSVHGPAAGSPFLSKSHSKLTMTWASFSECFSSSKVDIPSLSSKTCSVASSTEIVFAVPLPLLINSDKEPHRQPYFSGCTIQ